jgi:hypothetical protein
MPFETDLKLELFLVSTSQIAGIIGMHYYARLSAQLFLRNGFVSVVLVGQNCSLRVGGAQGSCPQGQEREIPDLDSKGKWSSWIGRVL